MRHLSFGRLSAVEFEEFCFDLLHALGFINIDWRKGTPLKSSPAHSGRDIVAHEERIDVDGSKRHEKWFVDCKHCKKAVPPNELRTVTNRLRSKRLRESRRKSSNEYGRQKMCDRYPRPWV